MEPLINITRILITSGLQMAKKLFSDIDEPQEGDIVYCVRDLFYCHFGIYIGNDEVIHVTSDTGDKNGNIRVQKTSLERFKNGDIIRVFNINAFCDKYGNKVNDKIHIYSPKETIDRAKKWLKKPPLGEEYGLLTNNCEAFAIWCKTDIALSVQAFDFLEDAITVSI